VPFGEGEIRTMTRQAADVLRWFDDMKNPVPLWYREA
jgi:serine/threonine-protein kinase